MATTFKTLTPKDVVSTRNMLHEAIPLTGAIVSGTYADENIQNFSHGIFQSVYDYPYLSSSANHVFDITAGYSNSSILSASSNTQNAKKINIYNEMAQVLVGFDENNTIRRFDEDGDFVGTATKINDAYFLNFARLLTKDEIKKGSFTLSLGVSASYPEPFGDGTTTGGCISLVDKSGSSGYKVNSPAGEYGILYATGSKLNPSVVDGTGHVAAGLLYYQAGVAVVSASVFNSLLTAPITAAVGGNNAEQELTASAISGNCDAFRHRINNLSFNNTTELNSTIYFCRTNHDEFNYSSNPTYLSGSRVVVKSQASDAPVTYITTVGLYSPDNELLAVAKLSEPIKKDPTTELTLRVRLDY
tara:strand:+ start:239 stop:1315 length:1077 start_codon:yes stop_codon:yes gene_type:complete